MTSDLVVAVDVSAAVVFFKSTNIWSCLVAIRPRDTLSCAKLAWMALMAASVVVVAATSPMALRMSWVSGDGLEVPVVNSSQDPSKPTPGFTEFGMKSRNPPKSDRS
jgi:hypothetical protein